MPNDWFNQKRTREGIPLEELFDASFAECVRDLVGAGVMVSAGATRDGGAVYLTVFLDGAKRREYVECREDMLDFLNQALAAATHASPAPVATSATGRRRKTS